MQVIHIAQAADENSTAKEGMFMRSVVLAVLAAGIVGGATTNRAAAMAAAPAIVIDKFVVDKTVIDVRWVCTRYRCVWDPFVPGPAHPWARRWGPPRHPGCWWERRRGRWILICP